MEDKTEGVWDEAFIVPTRYWHKLDDGRVQCDLCPRYCHLKDGQRGLCFVRACENGEIVLTTYGRSSGSCIDPIEKKPLFHFLPGTLDPAFVERDQFFGHLQPMIPAGLDLDFQFAGIPVFYPVFIGLQQGRIDLSAHPGQVGEIKMQ